MSDSDKTLKKKKTLTEIKTTGKKDYLVARSIDGLLRGGGGMHRCHQCLDDPKLVVDDLDQRSQAVGGAGGVADHGHVLGVLVLVHAHHKHGGVSRRRRNDNLAGASAFDVHLQMSTEGEDSSEWSP